MCCKCKCCATLQEETLIIVETSNAASHLFKFHILFLKIIKHFIRLVQLLNGPKQWNYKKTIRHRRKYTGLLGSVVAFPKWAPLTFWCEPSTLCQLTNSNTNTTLSLYTTSKYSTVWEWAQGPASDWSYNTFPSLLWYWLQVTSQTVRRWQHLLGITVGSRYNSFCGLDLLLVFSKHCLPSQWLTDEMTTTVSFNITIF